MEEKISGEKFLRLVQKSELVAPDTLEEAIADVADKTDAGLLAKALVDAKRLTQWQADRLLGGKYKGFFLSRYRLLGLIGTGAMGAVYLAEHAVMRRRCAVKVLPASRVSDASYLERFHREAQAVAALDHPNIVRAYDVDHVVEGTKEIHFLAMELIKGRDAQQVLNDKGPFGYDDAANVIRQVAEGLAHAHQANLIHRDIKPANLLVDDQGIVKILDLGLAKDTSDDEGGSVTLYHNETVLGTADYLSPEQALNSHDVDHRTDIYSLGCTMYCLLTGHPPFNEGSVAQRLAAHQAKDPPPIANEREDVPVDLAAIVAKMMEKEPEDRFQSASEVAETLAEWLAANADDDWKQQRRASFGDAFILKEPSPGSSSSGGASSIKLSEPAIGIDLGTTFSVIACLDAKTGLPLTLKNEEGDATTPSVVLFEDDGVIAGKEALKAAEFEPERVAHFAKRDMGNALFHSPIGGVKLPPEVIQSVILRKLKHDAELTVGPIRKAVITVPAYFTEPCRKATQDAGRLAGLEVLDIINEPTAAAIAYGVQQGFISAEGETAGRELVLVYDLGGGTFDATLMEIDGPNYRAIATSGDSYLGGIDWDDRIVSMIAEHFEKEHGVDLRKDGAAMERLLPLAADVKRSLTARESVTFQFAHEGKRIKLRLTREYFESKTADLIDRTRLTVKKLFRETKVPWSDVTRLLLVGGSTRMPMVQEMLEAESGLKVDRSLSPDEAVAHGAAIYAGILLRQGLAAKQGVSVLNVNSHDLGVMGFERATQRPRRQIIIPKNTTLPTSKEGKFRTAKDGQKTVLVNVVEGGSNTGAESTKIGRCIVSDLPADLPAKTPVHVKFEYAANGRLDVEASLPAIGRAASLTIERETGLSEEDLQAWEKRIASGSYLPQAEAEVMGIVDDDEEELGLADEFFD